MSPVSDRFDIHNVAPDIINILYRDSSFRFMTKFITHHVISTDTDLVISMSGSPQENDNNIEVVEAGAGPSQAQAWPQPRGYGGPQTRPWGGPQSWTRPQPQWSGPMGYSAPTWGRPQYQPRQAFPQYTKPWSAPQMVSSTLLSYPMTDHVSRVTRVPCLTRPPQGPRSESPGCPRCSAP